MRSNSHQLCTLDWWVVNRHSSDTSQVSPPQRGVAIEVTGSSLSLPDRRPCCRRSPRICCTTRSCTTSPPGGTVLLHTTQAAGEALLVVENSGSPVESTLTTLLEPFKRGTDRIYADQAGAGLEREAR